MKKIKNKSLLIAILMGAFVISGCKGPSKSSSDDLSISSSNDTTEAYVREPDYGVTVIKLLYEAIPSDGLTFKIDKFKNEFYLKLGDLYEKGNKEEDDKRLLNTVRSLFLADVNKDGYLDFIYTTESGRSRKEISTWIGVYDYHNNKELYRLDDPNKYDYRLLFDEHKLHVEQLITDDYESKNVLELNRVVGKGILEYSQSEIKTNWENFLKIDKFNVNVTLADKSRTPITLKPGEEENTFIIEHASVDKAYCITTNIIRNNGQYGDLWTNLPVGYCFNHEYRLVQAVSNNQQDNVIVTLEPDYLKRQDKKSACVEACISSFNFKLIFEYDTLNYGSNDKTLKKALNWDFSKDELIEFSREYVPGSGFNKIEEEYFPFMTVAIANGEEATKASYAMLEGYVSEIDPDLVLRLEEPSHYNFKTNEKVYSFDAHNPFIQNDNAFYLIIYSKDYSYATGHSKGYDRFRDSHDEIRVEAFVPGYENKILKKANKILFTSKWVNDEEVERLRKSALYTFTIVGNQFYITGSKTMLYKSNVYTAAFEYDFSSLFQ